MSHFELKREKQVGENNLGEPIFDYDTFKTLDGWLDLLSGSDEQQYQNSMLATSTHIFITEDTSDEILNTDRLYDVKNEIEYEITYPDNVMGLNHHYEIYCKRYA